MKYRLENDSMGQIRVPESALWGAQTQRALENFEVSLRPMPLPVIRALGLIKGIAGEVNEELGLLDKEFSVAISKAALEVFEGKLFDHFPIDIFQTGSGTSSNMNANEVIANRACQILGKPLGEKYIHPNDHVNMGQSSNDVFPTSIHIAVYTEIQNKLLPALVELRKSFINRATDFKDILKVGRTHLQDALPMTLGQEFGAYQAQIERSIRAIESSIKEISKLPLGGTAIGSGLNAHKDFAKKVIALINKKTSFNFSQTDNLFEGLSSKGGLVRVSSSLKELATDLTKISNDLRWLASGPRSGLSEITLPSLQPGSSIMPGKVNPVLPEMLLQICTQVIGNDTTIAIGALSGNFELNVMMPLIAKNVIESIDLLSNGISVFTQKCINGLTADKKRCSELLERSLMVVTNLTKRIGYDKASEIAKEAYDKNKTIREVVLEKKIISNEELDKLLDPKSMTGGWKNSQ